ncbi:tachykinin-like peptides receptor 86C [Ornithodoros turicata]|uniref:tachykinin-like peptides receptor 86C n=1 Tax=Ornithodoros turicata TaxID=34597 RepID=UPI003138ECB5
MFEFQSNSSSFYGKKRLSAPAKHANLLQVTPAKNANSFRIDRYNVVFLVLTYVLPVVTMGVTYFRMGVVLWGSRCIGEVTDRQQNALKAKQKVVRMLIAVVTLFSVCWLPNNVYFLYVYHFPSTAYVDYIQHIYLVMYWLAMSHAMYNPIVYYWMNRRFRSYFRKVLCCCSPQPDDVKVSNGRITKFQPSWTERQHTLRISLCTRNSCAETSIIARHGPRESSTV